MGHSFVICKKTETMKVSQSVSSSRRRRPSKSDETKLYQDIIARLDGFFKETPYKVEWDRHFDGKITAVVVYTDFFSEHLLRKMLVDVMPAGMEFEVKRTYSDKAVSQILLNEYKKNRVAVVDCYNGELCPETIKDFVSRKLGSVEML